MTERNHEGWQLVVVVALAVLFLGWVVFQARSCTDTETQMRGETEKARIEKGCQEVRCP